MDGSDASQPVADLVAAATRGEPTAWRELIHRYSRRVFALLVRQCGDHDLADELTQTTFIKVAERLRPTAAQEGATAGTNDGATPGYRESGRFEAWLFRIAMNQLRDEMRRRKRQANPVDFTAAPPEALGGSPANGQATQPDQPLLTAERDAALHAALAQLSDPERELLAMRYSAELTYPQIAEALDQPLGTVLARGHRALKKLKALLDGAAAPP